MITQVKGIDVSHLQGAINWETVAGAGNEFAFIKASEGLNFKDPNFVKNWQASKTAGLLRGAYHFFHPTLYAPQQAAYFLSALYSANGSTTLRAGDLPAVLDLEAVKTALPPSASYIAAVSAWLEAVEVGTGRTPIIYTNASFWDSATSKMSDFSRYPLWVAEYGVSVPKLPQDWDSYQVWQTGQGQVPGVTGPCDVDVFNGVMSNLNALAGQ